MRTSSRHPARHAHLMVASRDGGPARRLRRWCADRAARFAGTTTVRRADAAVWAEARSLTDVGDRVAMWLNGTIKDQPGYHGPVDVDESDAPGMTDALIAINRAGLVTYASQAGCDDRQPDGDHWQQCAAVVGFTTPATEAHLRAILADHPAFVDLVVTRCVHLPRRSTIVVAPVTIRNGLVAVDFGRRRSSRSLTDSWTGYGICHPEAQLDLLDAVQLAVYDRRPGANDRLWPALRHAAWYLAGR